MSVWMHSERSAAYRFALSVVGWHEIQSDPSPPVSPAASSAVMPHFVGKQDTAK